MDTGIRDHTISKAYLEPENMWGIGMAEANAEPVPGFLITSYTAHIQGFISGGMMAGPCDPAAHVQVLFCSQPS